MKRILLAASILAMTASPALSWTNVEPEPVQDGGLAFCSTTQEELYMNNRRLVVSTVTDKNRTHFTLGLFDSYWVIPERTASKARIIIDEMVVSEYEARGRESGFLAVIPANKLEKFLVSFIRGHRMTIETSNSQSVFSLTDSKRAFQELAACNKKARAIMSGDATNNPFSE